MWIEIMFDAWFAFAVAVYVYFLVLLVKIDWK